MEVNYITILVAAVVSMVVGGIWYGPLFGKKWMEINHATPLDVEARKKMQKEAAPFYAIQFILSILQVYILAHFVQAWEDGSGIGTAVWIWLGFVMPTIAACAMWNNKPNKVKLAAFLIQSGYFLVVFIIFGWVLQMWP